MNYDSQTDDELLRGVLYRADDAALSEDSDEADELMALFMEGQLKGDDRVAFFKYLDTHPEARTAVSVGAKHIEHSPAATPAHAASVKPIQPNSAGWFSAGVDRLRQLVTKLPQRGLAFAMATMLLFATTSALWLGWQSPSQVALLENRGGPSLIDYGYSPDLENLTGERGVESEGGSGLIQSFLDDTIQNTEERDQLKDAYGYLGRNQLSNAKEELSNFIQQHPKSDYAYYAWLGQGMASHMGQQPEDFPQAEAAFRTALGLHKAPIAARIGLAMALTRQGDQEEALAEWRQVDVNRLPGEQREAIAREIERLEKLQASPK